MSAPSQKPASSSGGSIRPPAYRIVADGPWSNAWKVAGMLGLVGGIASFLGMTSDPHRFAFSWLFAFMSFLAVGLGGLFFVLGQHLTGAGWGVTMRRTGELLLSGLPVFAILFIPIALNLDELYPWAARENHVAHHHHGAAGHHDHAAGEAAEHSWLLELLTGTAHAQETLQARDLHPGQAREGAGAEDSAAAEDGAAEAHHTPLLHTPLHAEHEEVLDKKASYLNRTFFFARAAVYFVVWALLAYFFVGTSTRQDRDRSVTATQKMQRFAPVATILFALTLTFAAFDWVMSLEPTWYSTMYGVQYFAVSVVTGFAAIILVTLGLRGAGLTGDAINVEHYHDLGKLLFGFIVFWAYVSFSQFMLIWYAGIPEEATYYHLRWWGGGAFQSVSAIVVLGHFVVPFFILISRNIKRRLPLLAFGATWVLVMHVVETYWLVMPYAEQSGLVQTSLRLHWMDLAALFAVGGVYASVVLWQMTRYSLIPIGDPRLSRALNFENA